MDFLGFIFAIFILFFLYVLILLTFSILSAKRVNRNVSNPPDWGVVKDHRIDTANGRKLECWVVYPDHLKDKINGEIYRENKAVILTHGWGRNRDRMVSRARIWADMGYTTLLFSARNHGNSGRDKMPMNIYKFTQDIESVVKWWDREVILQGHSIGAGASIIVASKNPKVKAVVADAPPRAIPVDLYDFYHSALGKLTFVFYPGIMVMIRFLFRKLEKIDYSPIDAVKHLSKPGLIQYGRNDSVFRASFLESYREGNSHLETKIFENAHHSNLCSHENYRDVLVDFVKRNIDNN